MNWNDIFYIKNNTLYKKPRKPGTCKFGREAMFNSKYADKPCGYKDKDGYLCVSLNGDGNVVKAYKQHRIIYEMLVGPLPKDVDIDHINGVKDDNRIENLRPVEHRINMKNMSKRIDNKTGECGVWFDKSRNKYQAYITIDGKRIRLGRFDSIIEAKEARDKVKRNHPEFTERHGK